MKIKYESVTGEVLEFEVPSDVAEVCIKIEDSTRRQDRKETRRHISLSSLEERGIEVSENTDIENHIIEVQKTEQLQEALKMLLSEQQKLIF